MCDPLSVTGSVIAVVTVAAQSCDTLCTFFQSYYDTAEYLKHYISTLEALKAVFASIAELDKESSHHLDFDQRLRDRLEECGLHLQAIEKTVMPSYNRLQVSNANRLWTKMKWSTAYQRQKIDKLMNRIESHCKTFVLTLLLLNTRLGLLSSRESPQHRKIVNLRKNRLRREHNVLNLQDTHKLTRCFRTLDAKARAYSEIASINPSTAKAKRGAVLKARHGSYRSLHRTRDIEKAVTTTTSRGTPAPNVLQVSGTTPVKPEQSRIVLRAPEREELQFRIRFAKSLERTLMPLLCWIGHVDRRGNSNREGSSSTGSHLHSGYAVGLAMTTYWCFALRLELVLYLSVWPKRRSLSLSFGCELKFPSVVTWDSEIVALALRGDVDCMKTRFAAGAASPFDVLPNGSTLLHLAVMENQSRMVGFLIQQGALLNAVDDYGDTPLHRSLELAKDYNISRILIENGADLCNRNIDGETPLHTHFGSVMEQVLLTHADLPDYSVRDGRGKTLLHHLAWSSRTSRETFERVSARSGRINSVVDGDQKSVLHHAVQRGNIAVVDYILTHLELNINVKDRIGRTPLHYAIESSRSRTVIELLVSNGANISAQDDEGCSALHLAAKCHKEAAVRSLVENGLSSEPLMEGFCGQTPDQIAEKNEAQNVLSNRTHAIDLRRGGWRVSKQRSSSGKEATEMEFDLSDGIEKKVYFPMIRKYLYELLSQQIMSAGAKPLRKALRVLLWAVLLSGIWLIVLGKLYTELAR